MLTSKNVFADALNLLEKYEKEMDRPQGLTYLSEALLLLDEIRTYSESETVRDKACSIAFAHLNKTKKHAEQLLIHNQPLVWETVFPLDKSF